MGVLEHFEDALEGSLLVHAHTDLGDLYRGTLTLRRVFVLIRALPPEAPLFRAFEARQAEAAVDEKVQSVDDAIAMMRGGG